MRVGFVLRSAEIKPLFYDLFIESILLLYSLVSSDVTFSELRLLCHPPHPPNDPLRVVPRPIYIDAAGARERVAPRALCERTFPLWGSGAAAHTTLHHHARDDGSLHWVRLPACDEYGHTT